MDLAPTIKELQAAGCESQRTIAAGLEERGIPAARGGKWELLSLWLHESAAVRKAHLETSIALLVAGVVIFMMGRRRCVLCCL